MRLPARAALAVALLSLSMQPGMAADIAATSKIDAVTVYRSGAEVSRTIRQEIDAGSHTLVIKDLPAETIGGSIRVEGQADGELQIGVVDAKRVSVLSEETAERDSERKAIEDELEQLNDEMDRLRAEVETREAQKSLIANLTSLPQQPPATRRDGAALQTDWSELVDLIGTSMARVQGEILKTRVAMRELSRKMEDVQKRLGELAPKQEQRTEIRVNVDAKDKLTADLVIKYQVGNASWQPNYDARLDTGSAEKAAGLVLTRRATIQQYTGEIWNDVTLTLSTSQPSGKSSAPTLTPLTVDFRQPVPVAALESARKASENRRYASPRAAMASRPQAEADSVAAAPAVAVSELSGQLQQTAFQASFTVPGRVSVPNTGEAKRVKLDDETITPKLNIRTVPRQDTNAYLYAKLELPNSAPYLAGPVALFRDGSFVGTGRLPNLAPGADHELGFGSDPSVTVKYHVLGEKRGESGIISSSSTDQRNFKIDISNQHAREIDVLVIDQMPVALNEDISVELQGPNAPNKRNFEDKRGVLAWEFELDAKAKRSISFGYTIAWPADKQIGFSHRH